MTINSILTLFAPRIPGWKTGAPASIQAHGGIPLALTYLYPDKGVKVFVDAYLQQEVGDNIDLYLNGVVVDVTVVETLEDQLLTLYLPVRALFDGLNIIHYVVRRGSENLDASTPVRAWFHKQRPGLKDLEGNHEWHSQLGIDILPPTAREDGIDPEQARQGVICTASYPLTRAFDKIRVRCAGESIEHEVSEEEARSGDPVEVHINEAIFKKIGDLPKCIVTYTAWDWIGNSVDLDAPWSAAIELYVALNGTWYEPPLVSEDPNDSSDDPDSIDLGKLAGQPAIAQVHAQRAWLKGDIVELTCTFTSSSGTREVLVVNETVDRAPFIYKLSVPHGQFVTAVGGSATFKYKLLRSGKEVGRSFTTRADVIGEALIDLPQVSIVGVPGLLVDPLAYTDGLIARVEFARTQPGDQCLLLARPVTTDRLPVFPARPFNIHKRVNNTLTIADLVSRHGTIIRLPWELTRNGIKTRSTATLLTVQKIVDEDPRLSRPKVVQAPDDKVLDLAQFEGNAEVRVLPWAGIREGQKVELRCVGVDSVGAEYLIPLLIAWVVTSVEVVSGLAVVLPREALILLRNHSELKIELQVKFDQGVTESAAVLFPVLRLEVIVMLPLLFENFDGQPDRLINVGEHVEVPSMTITLLRGAGQSGVHTYGAPIAGMLQGPGIVTSFGSGIEQLIRLDFKSDYRRVRFAYTYQHVASEIYFYDPDGLVIGERRLPAIINSWVDFSAPAGKLIRRMEFTSREWAYMDFFTFEI